MEIKLINIHVIDDMTDDSTAFLSHLYIDGFKAGAAGDLGDGVATFYAGYDEDGRRLIEEAEEWCSTNLDTDLETEIVRLLFEYIEKRDLLRFRSEMRKQMLQGIVVGIPDKEYRVVHLARPINRLISCVEGMEELGSSLLRRIIPKMTEGEKILNTNIPDSLFRSLGIDAGRLNGR